MTLIKIKVAIDSDAITTIDVTKPIVSLHSEQSGYKRLTFMNFTLIILTKLDKYRVMNC